MTVADAVAVAALVLAIVAIALELAFYKFQKDSQDRFVSDQSARATEVSGQMTETMVRIRESLAVIDQRALVVQEQVKDQVRSLTEALVGQLSRGTELRADEVLRPVQDKLVVLETRLEELAAGQVPRATVEDLLVGIRKDIATAPAEVATGMKEDMWQSIRESHEASQWEAEATRERQALAEERLAAAILTAALSAGPEGRLVRGIVHEAGDAVSGAGVLKVLERLRDDGQIDIIERMGSILDWAVKPGPARRSLMRGDDQPA